MKTKQCRKCWKVKDVTEFNNNKYTYDGKQAWCKECNRQYVIGKRLQPTADTLETERAELLKDLKRV